MEKSSISNFLKIKNDNSAQQGQKTPKSSFHSPENNQGFNLKNLISGFGNMSKAKTKTKSYAQDDELD